MDAKTLSDIENFAIDLVRQAGQMMRDASGGNLAVKEKQHRNDLVTEADTAVETFLFSKIRERFPSHKLIGEESTTTKIDYGYEPTWIIDPIDGTMNFVHRLPFVCVSVGFSVNKELLLGIVYNPFSAKLYTAKKGCGAYCNGVPIRVRKNESIENALVMGVLTGPSGRDRSKLFLENAAELSWISHGLRDIGSAALSICFVANGFADVFYHFGLHCWDMAAGVVILTEAGGCVTDTNGGPFDLMSRRFIAANNSKIAEAVKNGLQHQLSYDCDCKN